VNHIEQQDTVPAPANNFSGNINMTMQILLYKNKPPRHGNLQSGRRRVVTLATLADASAGKSGANPPATSNVEELHHKCAMKARLCWSLWNQGYPFARIIEHKPDGENYALTLDIKEACVIDTSNKMRHQPNISRTELATFLVDLIRLRKVNMHGKFQLAAVETNYSFSRMRYTGRRFVLLPVLEDIQNHQAQPTDLLHLAKIASTITLPSKARTFVHCTSIKSILQNIGELSLRKDKNTSGSARLVINIDDNPATMYLEIGKDIHAITANPHGFLMYSPPIRKEVNGGISVPIKLKPFPESGEVNPWIERFLCWQGIPKIWKNGIQNIGTRNTIGTLAAELRFAENACYEYKIEEHDIETGVATVRIERRDGNGNAHDLWEVAVRNREMNVALNTDKSVFNWSQDDEWVLEKIHDKDPYLLTVRAIRGKGRLSEKGFLKVASVPQRALMIRKEKLIRNGIICGSFEQMFHNQPHKMGPKNWRLSQNAAIMAVQGPPGTGKTWTACHVIKDILTENPYARILVSAKEHLALDHLTNRIRETLDPTFDVVRICNTESESLREIDQRALPKTIAERMLRDLSIPKSKMKEVGHLATWVEELAMRTASVVCTTTLDKTMESMQQGALCFDFAIIEEAGKSYPSELIGPLSISRQSLLIGDHLQLPPFELSSISETVADCFRNGIESWGEREARDSVERLLVEQSVAFNERTKFSATSAIRQVEKWLQPFQSIHMMTTGDTLRHQWRMFPALSNAIGKIFYGQQFELRKVNKVSDEHLPGIFGEHQNRLLMVDAHAGVEGKHNKSFSNKVEAKIAASNLLELCKIGAEAIIITPYKGQVAEIKSLLPEEFHGKVRTVDGFQGKEADFIILSLVRNNKRTGSARRWGFFRDPRRINVALSRAREGLLLITSQHHIKNTDWSENEGQLAAFVETIAENGKIVMEG